MILCCGEALVDMIPEPTAAGCNGFVPHSGGAIYNTSVALGRLGQQVGLLTGLSNDIFGQQLREGLVAPHVDTTFVITSNRPTTLAFVQLLDGHASYSFFDENSAGRMLTSADMPTLPDEVTALYFGGISLASEPSGEAYAGLLESEGKTRVVMLDPNIRESFIEDTKRYRARLDQMIARSDIVKVSDEDLNWIIEGSETLQEKAQALVKMGPVLVIATQGSDGATAFMRGGHEIHVPSLPAKVIDTVGAGDTFNAGVLASLSRHGVLDKDTFVKLTPQAASEALMFGAKVAAITVSRSGANPPWAHEL